MRNVSTCQDDAEGARYGLAPGVVLVEAPDGSVRLLDLDGHFYALPAPGAALLGEVLAHGVRRAALRLAERHGATAEQARQCLDQFLQRLAREGLVRGRGPGPASARRRGVALTVLLLPALLAVRALPGRAARAWALLGLARLSFRLFGWTRTMAAWQRCCPAQGPGTEAEAVARAVAEAVRAAAAVHPLRVECKERALACWALLRWAGAKGRLVIGVDLFPFAGHCWCESGPWTVSDEPERCLRFRPVVCYG
jgi:hypothetical protein